MTSSPKGSREVSARAAWWIEDWHQTFDLGVLLPGVGGAVGGRGLRQWRPAIQCCSD